MEIGPRLRFPSSPRPRLNLASMKILATVLIALLLSGCATTGPGNSFKEGSQKEIEAMLASTVQVHVSVRGFMVLGELRVPREDNWVGSGVVYEKTLGLLEPVQSKILTANHVLDKPNPGDAVSTPSGTFFVKEVELSISTRDGQVCRLEPLTMGTNDTEDVATAVAFCDAGRVARLGSRSPAPGSRVFVAGHPLGFPGAIVTDGYVSGWLQGYMLISAPTAGGSSGGPIFHNGEVVGLLVRGVPKYPHISLGASLGSVLRRVAATP